MTRVAPLSTAARGLAAAFVLSGVVHLVRPQVFVPLVPRWLPRRRTVVHVSGVAELVCAAGLVHPATRQRAGWASAALLVGVFPGNLTMAAAALHGDDRRRQVVALVRLPLQVPLVRIALRIARG